MEPYTTSSGAEAQRWLLIAEKLLAGRDLVGSKTFAIRARDSDPRLDAADQILAVADTLIAGDKRINNLHHDWYSILQLPSSADPDLIATHYHRLSILLNPHRNRLPFADHALKLVSDAWSVLSNPSHKSLYDNQIIQEPNPRNNNTNNNIYNNNNDDDDDDDHDDDDDDDDDDHDDVEEECEEIPNNNENQDLNSTFWTACPYCYNMFEYPGVYEKCSLRCQNCQRAFHGVKIGAPPPIVEGKEAYFCCWGFFPLGVSMSKLDKSKSGGATSWNPFSPMFMGPQFGDGRNVGEENVGAPGKNVNQRKGSAPRIYIDDQEVYVEIPESEEESGDEWGSNRQKKKAKNVKGKSSMGKSAKKPQGEKAKNVKISGGGGDDVQGGFVMQGVMGTSNAETSRKVAANSAKKQTGKLPKEWGKLDLNVEFSNEVEEPAPGMVLRNMPVPGMVQRDMPAPGMVHYRNVPAPGMVYRNMPPPGMVHRNMPGQGMGRGNGAANGEEDGIEGIGFFEGLDEFLSNLPILRGGLQG